MAKPAVPPTPPAPHKGATGGHVDKAWFEDQLRNNLTSARQLAKKVGLDPSAMSLLLSGQRRMKNEEAAAIALHLNVSLADVLAHAGVDLRGVARPTISVPVPSGNTIKLEIPPGVTPKDWEIASPYLAQFIAATHAKKS